MLSAGRNALKSGSSSARTSVGTINEAHCARVKKRGSTATGADVEATLGMVTGTDMAAV